MSDLHSSEEQVSDRYLTKMLAQFLVPFWWRIVIVFVLLLAATGLTLVLPYLVQRVVDGPIANGDVASIPAYGIAYLVTIVLLTVVRLGHTYLLQNIGQDALVDIRQTLFNHIMQQDMRFFSNTPVGQIVSRMSNDIDALTELLAAHPGADRQQLRQLARQARSERAAAKPPHAYRELFRSLRDLLESTPGEASD